MFLPFQNLSVLITWLIVINRWVIHYELGHGGGYAKPCLMYVPVHVFVSMGILINLTCMFFTFMEINFIFLRTSIVLIVTFDFNNHCLLILQYCTSSQNRVLRTVFFAHFLSFCYSSVVQCYLNKNSP